MSENPLGLRENPFRAGHHPKYVFPSREHQEALAHLRYGIQNREPFVLITGEVGTGKTTAVYDALAEWGSRAVVALITNPALTRSELLEEICLRFGVAAAAPLSKPHALVQLERQLSALRARGELAILLLDEAQNLDRELLEEIRLLSNLEVQGEKLLQIFLIAQPELEAKLARPELRQLRQRIGIHYRIQPLGPAETARYIHHRVAAAGGNAELFTPEACSEIFRITNGIPREINLVAGQALLNAFVEDARSVAAEHVRAVEREIEFQSVLSHRAEPVSPGEPPAPAGASASVAAEVPDALAAASAPDAQDVPDAAAPPAEPEPDPAAELPETALPATMIAPDHGAPTAPELPRDAERMAPEPPEDCDTTSAARPGTPVSRAPAWPPIVFPHAMPAPEPTPRAATPAHEVRAWEPVHGLAPGALPSAEPEPFVADAPWAPPAAQDAPCESAPVANGATPASVGATGSPESTPQLPGHDPATGQPVSLLPAWFDEVIARAGATEETTVASAAGDTVTDSAVAPISRLDSAAPAFDADLASAPLAAGSDLVLAAPELASAEAEPARSRVAGIGLLLATLVIATVAIGAILLVRLGSWTRQAPRPPGALSHAPAAPGETPAADAAPTSVDTARSASASAAGDPSGSAPAEKRSASSEPTGVSRPTPDPASADAAAAADPVVRAPARSLPPDLFGISVGTYLSEERALAQRASLSGRTSLSSRVIMLADDRVSMYRVVMGGFPDRASAERAANDLILRGLVTEARVIPLSRGTAVYR